MSLNLAKKKSDLPPCGWQSLDDYEAITLVGDIFIPITKTFSLKIEIILIEGKVEIDAY